MRVTTMRFGDDLWRLLEHEAGHAGVSVSQYVREAALARAAAGAAGRGESPFELLTGSVREVYGAHAGADEEQRHAVIRALAGLARALSSERAEENEALRRESRQAVRRATRLRARHGRPEGPAGGDGD